ncbi:phosphoinositide 5-phosphatase INP54 NDAI_0G02850 [Naumovozyma dairenensis CBS 421]|uniref:Inositol polyphosphate-related phosphatase domain-containing protein n=1 Tax=Naumovozyma dairenensis (strain ATCC 10597 / BCRC 20456 / CBS 421 / NBRC 0211 / NRRL Y-12639) TaxID=1071378 RepID=G0WE51_NAUDC|nr:hypothetical protein NDAI_0G02850 [Naumovozyma dairenensis CBS 421]CCD26062.2 hypothetical protein NDAI_0G02850 [Naumovozyma dairenensis CBS 421]
MSQMKKDWKVSISTLNCGKISPLENSINVERIIQHLIPALKKNKDGSHLIAADIYAFGFQELSMIWEGSLPTVMQSYNDILSKTIIKVLNERFRKDSIEYSLVGSDYVGATSLVVVCRNSLHIEKVWRSRTKCGMFGSNLKGGVGLGLALSRDEDEGDNDTFIFVCSHLNANEGYENMQKRCADFTTIINNCDRDFKEILEYNKDGHYFFFGDMNFRVNGWEHINTNYNDLNTIETLATKYDELQEVLKSVDSFKRFDEAEITFPPTYKYEIIGDKNKFNKKRSPSWCDRVLFKKYNGKPRIISYHSIERTQDLQFTDHQGVNLTIEVGQSSTISSPLQQLLQSLEATERGSISVLAEQTIDTIDWIVGYVAWFMHYKAHYWIGGAIILLIIYYLL